MLGVGFGSHACSPDHKNCCSKPTTHSDQTLIRSVERRSNGINSCHRDTLLMTLKLPSFCAGCIRGFGTSIEKA